VFELVQIALIGFVGIGALICGFAGVVRPGLVQTMLPPERRRPFTARILGARLTAAMWIALGAAALACDWYIIQG
jgi:hypothetical protein